MRASTSILLGADAPRVLTVPMIEAVLAHRRKAAARATVFKWIRSMTASGALRPVTRGLYINQLAQPRPAGAEAASYVRAGAIVSLQSVLGEAGVTNNYPDMVTCVVPIHGRNAPSSRPVVAADTEFRFHAMPARLLGEEAGALEDRMDLNVRYPRATSEKALLDWIYLGASPRTKITGPPLDVDLGLLSKARLMRLAKHMKLTAQLNEYLKRKREYDRDPEVQANASDWMVNERKR
jgi:hypothetical protein